MPSGFSAAVYSADESDERGAILRSAILGGHDLAGRRSSCHSGINIFFLFYLPDPDNLLTTWDDIYTGVGKRHSANRWFR
jgi:hypothetical protein